MTVIIGIILNGFTHGRTEASNKVECYMMKYDGTNSLLPID